MKINHNNASLVPGMILRPFKGAHGLKLKNVGKTWEALNETPIVYLGYKIMARKDAGLVHPRPWYHFLFRGHVLMRSSFHGFEIIGEDDD